MAVDIPESSSDKNDKYFSSQKREELYRKSVTDRGLLYSDCLQLEDEAALETLSSDRDWLEKNYGIEIDLVVLKRDLWNGAVEIKPGSLAHKARVLRSLRQELGKYPPSLFEKLAITKIVVAGAIESDGRGLAGFMGYKGELYLARAFAFQHELFHQLDLLAGGSEIGTDMMSDAGRKANEKNREWAKLRKEKGRVPGRTNDEEQADYFTYLMNLDKGPDWYKENLKYVSEIDPDKVEYMKKELYRWSDGVFDEKYWKDLEAGRVDRKYWS